MNLKLKTIFLLLTFISFSTPVFSAEESISLDGKWLFTLDNKESGETEGWYKPEYSHTNWRSVTVPHTWQTEPGNEKYFGVAWYYREIESIKPWENKKTLLEFDAVYRDCKIWLNGELIGEHKNSGWTPFHFPITLENNNSSLVIRVDNRFTPSALPYKDSFDWANDGGIIRSVRMRILPESFIKRVFIDAVPSSDFKSAGIQVQIPVRGLSTESAMSVLIYSPEGSLVNAISQKVSKIIKDPTAFVFTSTIDNPSLWHFDFPNLYTAKVRLLHAGEITHEKEIKFGIRKVEVKEGRYFLNGEPMRLMGVEWMPGSDPRYGMAESPEFMRSVLRDMKALNCLITRFHWQQDDSVFEFMDREGMLTQEEIPSWGGKTMEGDLTEIQAQQSQEMILAHYNHPSIYAWGLCNEIGETGKSYEFVKHGSLMAHELDPNRLQTHASNALQSKDIIENVSGYASNLVDFIEWNDYWESWYKGDLNDCKANLDRIKQAFPEKSVVISEYGLCECDPKNPTGDARRIEILKTHTDLYRAAPNVAGAIFFDYNDYRTHIGDKGQGSFQQRVHGVVDLLNQPKPSLDILRRECSPIKTLSIAQPQTDGNKTSAKAEIITRALENDLPAYTLRQYLLIWTAYNNLGQPIGTGKKVLPDIQPGTTHTETLDWPSFENLARIRIEVFRPTGYSVIDAEWKK